MDGSVLNKNILGLSLSSKFAFNVSVTKSAINP